MQNPWALQMSRFETSLHGIDLSIKYTMRYEALHAFDRTTSSTNLIPAPNPIPGVKKMLEDDFHQFQVYTCAKHWKGYISMSRQAIELLNMSRRRPFEALPDDTALESQLPDDTALESQ
ncbi:hypothetical protein Pst134EA_026673 [Puccinia striiformis f. sp. tritici]|uniref:hypothetical protein n=1 Tax=Puccinia striiformis f. sp. tritici TaxID=168172 RepID=UPI00200890CB|nr:hypothetical protein Pst134EA_026673 [Puccinia striiformis f. sp. tritici]KAH9442879.1 hypothetical protein Pst134EB_027232 [Puccinia striiformis f. sp. tritici]KAH9449960.1 hypothetical protein Pst134EA_026673 [Puccinia striiformis f. sp. tritici]